MFNLRLKFPQERITRRLFAIFTWLALLPVCLLSLVALSYVSSTSQEQINSVLDREVTTFGDMLVGRLRLAEERLALFDRNLDTDVLGIARSWAELDALPDGQLVFGVLPSSAFAPDAEQAAHFERGRSLLVVRSLGGGKSAVYLLRRDTVAYADHVFAVARIGSYFLLGDPTSRDYTRDYCVYMPSGARLYATDHNLCREFGSSASVFKGRHSLNTGNGQYYMTYRSLFLRERFLVHDWKVSIVTRSAEVLQISQIFRSRFAIFASLVLLVVSLLSIRLIRRQMAPLSAIMEGIDRVSQQDYDERVEVHSGDEFEELADAFNQMSGRVSQQLATQESMSEIDRMILARCNKEDILRIVLRKTLNVLPGDSVALLMPEARHAACIYWLDDDCGEGFQAADVELLDEDRKQLMEIGPRLVDVTDDLLPLFLLVPYIDNCRSLLLVPITLEGQLVAVAVIGFHSKRRSDPEELELAARYADRIAVGLSNAEWEERLYRQAHYDSLTGLPNRMSLTDQLRLQISQARRDGDSFGLLFVDLDNFKLVNDTLGHDVGDQCIREMSERLSQCLREEDVVARLGGDEFVVLAVDGGHEAADVPAMNALANRILQAAEQPMVIKGYEWRSSASIGIALYPRDGETPEELMKNADLAMYHAKATGRGKFHFYSEELNARSEELMRLSVELKAALAQRQFEVYFQPKVDSRSLDIVGAEALIRWNHPQRGLLSPAHFIDAAESLGLVNQLGDWILEDVCRQIHDWREAGLPVVPVSINVSANQIRRDNLLQLIELQLQRYQLCGSDLELEITEGVLVTRIEETVSVLNAIRELGTTISIDDYGTGYSSLSYMKTLPVDKLKIDRSFIIGLCSDDIDQAIVNSTILLSRSLGLKVIAEGVEEAGQLAILREFGCHEIQGFYFSPPVPAGQFADFLVRGIPGLEECG